jgi:hypothetical protein
MSFSFRHAAFTVVLLSVAFTAHAKTAGEIYEQASRSTVVVENINDKGEIAGLNVGYRIHSVNPHECLKHDIRA